VEQAGPRELGESENFGRGGPIDTNVQNPCASLEVGDLVKRYSSDVAIGPISFSVQEGEFFSLLGASGCGKTTILRSVAGLESIDEGEILLNGRRLDDKPPHKRGVGLVFQHLTLFPHLTAAENVAFGLALRKRDKAEIETRVASVLDLVGLSGLGGRMPNQLSGGQQQRVALARSLVLEPPLMLMDEPLSSLDLKLRIQMREELRRLQQRLRKTTIFVTHDQTEALALSDRIAVVSQGRIEQIGTPQEIYRSPISSSVASFIGNSNLLRATVVSNAGVSVDIETESGLTLTAARGDLNASRPITALIRPECIHLLSRDETQGKDVNRFAARVIDAAYLGEDTQLTVMAGEKEPFLVSVKSGGGRDLRPDFEDVHVYIDPDDVFILSK